MEFEKLASILRRPLCIPNLPCHNSGIQRVFVGPKTISALGFVELLDPFPTFTLIILLDAAVVVVSFRSDGRLR